MQLRPRFRPESLADYHSRSPIFRLLARLNSIPFVTASKVLLASCMLLLGPFTIRQALAEDKGLPRIAAGTLVEESDAKRWNRVVLLAKPRIASGDVDSLTRGVRDSVSAFVLTLMATVEAQPDAQTGAPKYQLAEIGVGYSADIKGKPTVVTLDSARRLGLSLGFLKRQLLSENEKQLKTVYYVARTSTLAIFDAPAIMFQQGKHRDYIMRHFVWIDSRTGKNSMLVWLLEKGPGGAWRTTVDPIRHLSAGFKEDRTIHVDGDEFTFGIPSQRAFALDNLPNGRRLAWSPTTSELAARDSYSMEQVRDLTVALNVALQASKNQ